MEEAKNKSLFSIENDLATIFMEIEDNDGEITPELEEKLKITQENLQTKLGKYVDAIRYYEDNIVSIKNRKKELDSLIKVRENRVKKLRSCVTDAVINFGTSGKSGNKSIELWDTKLFTRSTEAVDVKTERTDLLTNAFFEYAYELYNADILETGEDVDPKGMLDAINAKLVAEYGEDFVPFTMGDFANIKFNISFEFTPQELLTDTQFILKAAVGLANKPTIISIVPKDKVKSYIKVVEENDVTIATINKNTSINIK